VKYRQFLFPRLFGPPTSDPPIGAIEVKRGARYGNRNGAAFGIARLPTITRTRASSKRAIQVLRRMRRD
jgi:hypothetical protein